jgi:hypothetical protein
VRRLQPRHLSPLHPLAPSDNCFLQKQGRERAGMEYERRTHARLFSCKNSAFFSTFCFSDDVVFHVPRHTPRPRPTLAPHALSRRAVALKSDFGPRKTDHGRRSRCRRWPMLMCWRSPVEIARRELRTHPMLVTEHLNRSLCTWCGVSPEGTLAAHRLGGRASTRTCPCGSDSKIV